MNERLAIILKSIPEPGLALHGTNSARAASISQNGFLPDSPVDYCLQRPVDEDPVNVISNVAYALRHALKASNIAEYPQYRFGENLSACSLPEIVVSRAPLNGTETEVGFRLYPQDGTITKPDVIGAVKVGNLGLPPDANFSDLITKHFDQMTIIALRIYRLLARKKVLDL